MEPVGLLDIMKRTKQIILKNVGEFGCIAMFLAIPYAFQLTTLDLSTLALDSMVGFVISMFTFIHSKDQFLPPPIIHNATAATPPPPPNHNPFSQLDLPHLPFSHFIFHSLLSFLVPLLSIPLLTFSVSRLNSSLDLQLDLKGSLLLVPRCAKNLALASLCMGVVLCVCFACVTWVFGILTAVVLITNGNMALSLVMFNIWIGVGVCGVYVAIVFSLTHTVAILEEKSGWGAMKRSMDLLNGRKWVALGLACVVYGMSLPGDFSVLWGWRGATILKVSLQTLIALFGMTSRVVLYMSCKSRLDEEPPHVMLMAGTPQFGPLDSFPKSMDLETHALLTPQL